MKKRIALLLLILSLTVVLSATVLANTYEADNDGLYELNLELEPNGEYVLFAIKGYYDQTNYIEIFESFSDEDLIYFEQKTVAEDGSVSFGPFAPKGYYDATLIVTGTTLEEPLLAGYLSANGISNYAKIDILGVMNKYTVDGIYGSNHVIDIDTKVYDSFGYEGFYPIAPSISLLDAKNGVTLDEENGVVTISNTAEAQVFGIVANIGETKSIKYVEVARTEATVSKVEVFDSFDATQPVTSVETAGTANNYPSITFYAKSYNQFGEEVQDTYSYLFDEKTASNTIKPTNAGTFNFVAISDKSPSIMSAVTVTAVDYEKNSLALYNLIEKCEEELSLVGIEKFVCDENGKSVFAPYKWTTTAKKTAFETALANAKEVLLTYNEANDADFADDVTALQNAYNTYTSSFKVGIRKDVTSINFENESYLFPVATVWNDIGVITTPRLSATTDKITYVSSDPAVAEVNENGEVKAKGNGTVTITAKTRGGLVATTKVTSYRKVTTISLDKTKYTADFSLENIVVDAEISPNNTAANYYGDTIVWQIENPELASLVIEKTSKGERATVIPKKSGKTSISVYAQNSGKSDTAELVVVMPDWETVASPVASVVGNVEKGTPVVLTCDTEDAVIYYTLDGTIPSKTNGRTYYNPIVVSQDLVITAVAIKDGMFDSDVVTYEYNTLDTTVSVAKAVAKAGDSTRIDVNLADFVDVKNASIEIAYDSENFVLTDAVFAEGVAVSQGEATQMGKYAFDVSVNDGQAFDGKVLTLEFDVFDVARDGNYVLEVIKADVFDINNEPRNVSIQNGEILVRDYILGDANDDGKIGLEDVLVVKQYAAGNVNAKKNILLIAADVNGDGVVDKNDSTLIAQYCVGLVKNFN